ncbi:MULTISPECIES: PD-(D/E)XK nuclease family protein [Bacteroidales]|uniref:PD-(D/E)XK nuclease superfamily protein n=1 Tax=Bacteroides ovatus TaxID=28116 RepID=A0A1G8EN15_BACOV|nr:MULTISPECIES: PD-(D/E)XK nuclease family protein [Bacteroidales]MCL3854237.1 PD-(D/E)XK nuclease family protein [Parabacteroides leei]SDH71304.1 PD-(D/E)XK nuclease superfamily protein [Bacteroides ovatus]
MIETLRLANRLFQCKLDSYMDGIYLSNQVAGIIAKHKETRPFQLNVIEAACHGSFKETGHSLVLANMLKHPYIQMSFLETFLSISPGHLKVTAEKDRVDVALKGKDIFVIVENKVNGAEEKKNQVYRYVHKIGMEKYGYKMNQIFVVYLNPTSHTIPTDESLCDENKENNVFEDIGDDHYTVLSYKYDITEWLRKITIDNEPHVSSALDQYIDFLEQKFHTSPLDKNMNNEIKNLIIKELHIEDKSFEEQMNALENQRTKAEELMNAIATVRDEIKMKHSHETILEWQKQLELLLGVKFNNDKHSFGIKLINDVWLGIWDGSDSEKKAPYWGFQYASYRVNSMSDLDKDFEKILKNAEIDLTKIHKEKGWIAWCHTQNGIERFSALYRAVKDAGFLDSND